MKVTRHRGAVPSGLRSRQCAKVTEKAGRVVRCQNRTASPSGLCLEHQK